MRGLEDHLQPSACRQCSIAPLLSRFKHPTLPLGRPRAPRTHRAPSVDRHRHRSRTLAITGGPYGISCTTQLHYPFQEGIPLGTAVIQDPLPPPSQAPIAFVCSFLLVWPSSRRQCGTAEVWGHRGGSTRFPRGWRTCPGERLCALHDFNRLDGRRLEVVVDGLPLWDGAQLAIDTTMVSRRLNAGKHSQDRWESVGRCQNPENQKIP